MVNPGRLPYRDFPGADIDGLMNQIKAVQGLDFEVMALGHSRGPTVLMWRSQAGLLLGRLRSSGARAE